MNSTITSSGQKEFRSGTHRTLAPEITLARARRIMPALGITRVADITGLDDIGVPVATAYRPNARSLAVSLGKGLDLQAAKASALMESIETWHAERIHLPLLLASVSELRFKHRLAEVQRLPRIAEGELHDHLRMLWIEGEEIGSKEARWVPFEIVNMNFTLPLPTGSGALLCGSNGLASGNHLLEATSHAICELVERDAMTLWRAWRPEQKRNRRLNLSTVDDRGCQSVLGRFERANVACAVWEVTSDVGLPVFRCLIAESDASAARTHLPGVGSGCHPDKRIALLRALTEAAQTRLTLIAGSRDDLGVGFYAAAQDRARHEKILSEIRDEPETRSFADVVSFESDTCEADVLWEHERLRAVGCAEVVRINLTKPEFGIPVVRIVIPGLEGTADATGYVPGPRFVRQVTEAAS